MAFKAGIIGLGTIGKIHYNIYKNQNQVEEVFLVDNNPETLASFPEKNRFTNYQQIADKVDLVSIATPTQSHFTIAKFFLERKIPVLLEKPLTNCIEEADQLIEIAEKNKTLLLAGHVERYNNAFSAAKKFIVNPQFIESHRISPFPARSLDISVVLDLMIHDLDIILDIVNDKVKDIKAKGVHVLSKYFDIANARIEFQKGCVANITSSRISRKKERKLRIFTDNNYISIDFANQQGEIYQRQGGKIICNPLTVKKEPPLEKEIQEFIDRVTNKSISLESAKKARCALELAVTIEKIIENQ